MDGIGRGIGQAIGMLVIVAGIGIVATLGLGGYAVADYFWIDDVHETTEIMQPELKLVVDENNEIDSVYVYRFE